MTQHAQVNIEVTLGTPASPLKSVYQELAPPTTEPRTALNALWRLFNAIAGRLRQAKVRVRVDGITDFAAFLSLAVTQANLAVGEFIVIAIPGRGTFKLVAVAAAADVTLGQFVSQTSDNVTATNIRAAINGMIGLKDMVVASGATNAVIVTSVIPGEFGNGIRVVDGTVNALTPAGGLLAGGLEAHAQVTSTLTWTFANITAADTITLGGVVLTWRAAAANENEVTIGANLAAAVTNFVAAINAHTKFAGIMTATGVTATGVVTLTYRVPARVAILIPITTSDATMVTIVQPATNLTLVNGQATREYDCIT